jgi:hypothetical protein
MNFETGKKYDAVVVNGNMSDNGKGEPLVWVKVKTSEGVIEWSRVVRGTTLIHACKTLQECFAITQADLVSEGYFESGAFTKKIVGTDVSVTAKSKELSNGDTVWEVEWMNPPGFYRKPATSNIFAKASAIFGGKPAPAASGSSSSTWGITDDDIPF